MSDDLTVMGIAATAAAAMGREQIVLAHQAEHPLAGNVTPADAYFGRHTAIIEKRKKIKKLTTQTAA